MLYHHAKLEPYGLSSFGVIAKNVKFHEIQQEILVSMATRVYVPW